MKQVWVRKCASFEEERVADREFWAQMAPADRIAAVEELREDFSRPNSIVQLGVAPNRVNGRVRTSPISRRSNKSRR